MARRVGAILATLTVVAALICLGASPAAAQAKMQLKLGTSAPVNKITLTTIEGAGLSSEHTVAEVFSRIVEEKTGGQITVKIYPDSQLGDEREQWQSLQEGILHMSTSSCEPLAGFVPEWMAFSIPYLTDSEEVLLKALDGPAGQEMKKLVLDKIKVRILGWSFLGFRNFTTSKKPVKTAADFKGLKIRVTQSPEKVKMVESLGAQAVPISWSELYTALQQGVVDGQENPFSMIQQAKLYEVQKYVVADGHTLGVLPITISEKTFQSLTPEQKRIVQDAALKAITIFRAQLYLGNTLWVEDLKKKGMTIYTPTAAELKGFRDTVQKAVVPYIRSQIGDAWVDKVLKAVQDSEKDLFK
ncbi:MAG: TRAP transporter substrate-binding protein [Thermodesulfobacteriota bacterium]